MSVYAKVRAVTTQNILEDQKATGLESLSPIVISENLASRQPSDTLGPYKSPESLGPDLALFDSFPSHRTKRRQAGSLLKSLCWRRLKTSYVVERHTVRVIRTLESKDNHLVSAKTHIEYYIHDTILLLAGRLWPHILKTLKNLYDMYRSV